MPAPPPTLMSPPAGPAVEDDAPRATGLRALALASVPTSVWVVADQAIVSLANFVTMLLLVRIVRGGAGDAAAAEALGIYGLGWSILVLVYSAAKAVIWTPYTTHAAAMPPGRRAEFTGSVTLHAALLAAAVGLGFVLTAAALPLVGQGGEVAWLFNALAVAMPLILMREHVRQVWLARLELRDVALTDFIASGVQLVVVGALARAGWLDGATAFLALAAGVAVSVVLCVAERSRFRFSAAAALADWRLNWPFAKWVAGGAAATQLGNQGTRWVLYGLYGGAVMGVFTSAQSVIQIANPLLVAVANYFGPVSARVYADRGFAGLWRHTVRSTWVLTGLLTAGVVALLLVGPPFIAAVFGGSFSRVSQGLILSVALGVFSDIVRTPIDFAALALGMGRMTFSVSCMRLAINATLGVALVWWLGPIGIGYGMLIASLASMAWQWGLVLREGARG